MPNVQKKTILVVDDDPSFLKIATSILALEGYDSITAPDGIGAMVQLKNHKPSLVILDVMMPEVNGYDVCQNIKFNSPYKDIPILLVTSRDQEIDPRIAQLMGIEYLQKPLNREVFIEKIKKALK